MTEEILKGGQSTELVVKIGNTVHRSPHENSEFIHKLLLLLESKKYAYSPRFLGMDEQNREILTFIDGEVINDDLDDDQLKDVVKMLRAFHDATAGSELTGNMEVISHSDLAPWNTIIKNNKIVGFIDFDGAKPGNRVDDLAYMLWTFLDLGPDKDIDSMSIQIKMLCDEYGFSDGKCLVDAILEQQRRVIHIREEMIKKGSNLEFNNDRITLIRSQIEWVEKHGDKIIEKFKDNN